MIVAIIACEIGFWVLLGAGLISRYLLRMRRTSNVLLIGAPVVDLILLVVTTIDLRRGTPPDVSHGLAAVYLGFSVAFGHDLIRWADVRFAHRFAGGPAPTPKPRSGTPARVRKEWRDWGLGAAGLAVTAAVAGLLALFSGVEDPTPLVGMIPGIGIALVVWLVFWPLAETLKLAGRRPS